MPEKDVVPFARGLVYGIVVNGIWGDVTGLYDTAKLPPAPPSRRIRLRGPCTSGFTASSRWPEARAIKAAVLNLAEVWPAIQTLIANAGDFVGSWASGDSKAWTSTAPSWRIPGRRR